MGIEWTDGLKLTDTGARYVELASKSAPDLSIETLTFACFLNENRGLIMPAMDVSNIQREINVAIKNGTLFFPNNIGRELHDELVRQFPNRERTLTNEDAVKVLKQVSTGVYQVGQLLVGPFGVSEIKHFRNLIPRVEVPSFQCSIQECFEVHPLRLDTNQDAEINRALMALGDVIGRNQTHGESLRIMAFRELFIRSSGESTALFNLLVDGLSRDEILILLNRLYEDGELSYRNLIRSISKIEQQSFPSGIQGFTLAQLMQLVLIASDVEIIEALEFLVTNLKITLGENEVRHERISQRWSQRRSKKFELSQWGLRARGRQDAVALNLMEMVHTLYFGIGPGTPEDLAFHLDHPAQGQEEILLNEATRLGDAETVVTQVLLPESKLAKFVANKVGSSQFLSQGKARLAKAVVWKLGGDVTIEFEGIRNVLEYAGALRAAANSRQPADELRALTANLYHALEDSMRRALIFTTWALTCDHQRANCGFEFDPDMGSQILEVIEKATSTQNSYRLDLGGKNSFAPLAAGFARLAETLEHLSDSAEPTRSPEHEIITADFEGQSHFTQRNLKSTRPQVFIDGPAFSALVANSQLEILQKLREVSGLLGRLEVAKIRNAMLHPENPVPVESEFEEALHSIEAWCNLVLAAGIYPTVSRLMWIQTDDLGRNEALYESPDGSQRLFRPQWHETGRMPLGGANLIFMSIAHLGPVGALRFSIRLRGNDQYWAGYPHRVRSDADV